MRLVPELVTPPSGPVVPVWQLMDHCRVDGDLEGDYLMTLQEAAVAYLEGWRGVLGRAILPQTWRQEFAGWGDLRLALPDVDPATVEVEGFDQDDEPLAATEVQISSDEQGWWVTATGPDVARVRVTYDCGLPADQLPRAQLIVKMLVGHWYANREAVVVGMPSGTVPLAAQSLITSLRKVPV